MLTRRGCGLEERGAVRIRISADNTSARVLEGDERQARARNRFRRRDRRKQRSSRNARTLGELEEEERKCGEHEHRCRHTGLHGGPWNPPALHRKSRVETLAKIR